MKLSEKRQLFTALVVKLIQWANTQPNYAVALDQVKRTKEAAALEAKEGDGITNSLHSDGLAADILLYINGVYQTDSAAYAKMGEYWKTLHPLARWGGDFKKRKDGNHFSLEHNGVK